MGLPAVILAGGASRRMGRDKASLVINGRALISHVMHSLRLAGSECFLIQVRDEDDVKRLSPLLEDIEVAWSLDDPAKPGLLDALRGALEIARSKGWDAVQLAPVDTPHVQPELFAGLASLLEQGCDAVLPTTRSAQDTSSGGLEPLLACLWVEATLRAIDRLEEGDLRVTRVFEDLDSVIVGPRQWSVWGVDERCFWNLNRPEDLNG